MIKTIIFQGDSITDMDRHREFPFSYGRGYANIVASEMGYKYPNQYKFYNKGVSGNRITDLYARIKSDILNLNPDYLSILIGVNDVWHEIEDKNGVDAIKFEKIYNMLLSEILSEKPDIKILLMEPYVLKYTATKSCWDEFKTEIEKRQKIVRKLAKKYKLPSVSLQDAFDIALTKADTGYWTQDGVHPTPAGNGLIANCWIDAFNKYFM